MKKWTGQIRQVTAFDGVQPPSHSWLLGPPCEPTELWESYHFHFSVFPSELKTTAMIEIVPQKKRKSDSEGKFSFSLNQSIFFWDDTRRQLGVLSPAFTIYPGTESISKTPVIINDRRKTSPGGGNGNPSSILAWRIPWRGAIVRGVMEMDTTEWLTLQGKRWVALSGWGDSRRPERPILTSLSPVDQFPSRKTRWVRKKSP